VAQGTFAISAWGNAEKGGMQAAGTRRTANETAAVITFTNAQMPPKPQ
jgi:hypothetical protein